MKARAKRKDNGQFTERDLGKMYQHVIDPTTIEYQVNGEWLSEGDIAIRLQECTRLRAEVERLKKYELGIDLIDDILKGRK